MYYGGNGFVHTASVLFKAPHIWYSSAGGNQVRAVLYCAFKLPIVLVIICDYSIDHSIYLSIFLYFSLRHPSTRTHTHTHTVKHSLSLSLSTHSEVLSKRTKQDSSPSHPDPVPSNLSLESTHPRSLLFLKLS